MQYYIIRQKGTNNCISIDNGNIVLRNVDESLKFRPDETIFTTNTAYPLIAGSGRAGNLHTIKTNPRNIKVKRSDYRGNVPYDDYVKSLNEEILEISPNVEGDFWSTAVSTKSSPGKFTLSNTGELKVVSGMKKDANVVVKTFNSSDIYGDLVSRLSENATCVNTFNNSEWDTITEPVFNSKPYIKNIATSNYKDSDIYHFQEDPEIGELYDRTLPKDENNKYRQRCPDLKPVTFNDILIPGCNQSNMYSGNCSFISEPSNQDLYCESWIGRPEEVINRERPEKIYKPSIRSYGLDLYGIWHYLNDINEIDKIITDNGKFKTLTETNKNVEKIYKDRLTGFLQALKDNKISDSNMTTGYGNIYNGFVYVNTTDIPMRHDVIPRIIQEF